MGQIAGLGRVRGKRGGGGAGGSDEREKVNFFHRGHSLIVGKAEETRGGGLEFFFGDVKGNLFARSKSQKNK